MEKVPVHKVLLLPDCRRPWRTWVDTSSWDDHAFFSRSGLQRYLLGSVARRETIRPFASPAVYQDVAHTGPHVFHPHPPQMVLDASGGPPSSIFSHTTDPHSALDRQSPSPFLFLDRNIKQDIVGPNDEHNQEQHRQKRVTYSKSPFPRWLPWPRREGDPHSNHLTVPRLPTRGLTRGRAMACTNTRCPPEPGREALTDSWELGEGTCSP